MHHPIDRMAHTTAFVKPVMEHWLEREIAQWVHPMKDRSDDPSHHERTLLPRSYISLPYYYYYYYYDCNYYTHISILFFSSSNAVGMMKGSTPPLPPPPPRWRYLICLCDSTHRDPAQRVHTSLCVRMTRGWLQTCWADSSLHRHSTCYSRRGPTTRPLEHAHRKNKYIKASVNLCHVMSSYVN